METLKKTPNTIHVFLDCSKSKKSTLSSARSVWCHTNRYATFDGCWTRVFELQHFSLASPSVYVWQYHRWYSDHSYEWTTHWSIRSSTIREVLLLGKRSTTSTTRVHKFSRKTIPAKNFLSFSIIVLIIFKINISFSDFIDFNFSFKT
jgi:hypothetical protein